VDFIDIAEVYPVPPDPSYAGRACNRISREIRYPMG